MHTTLTLLARVHRSFSHRLFKHKFSSPATGRVFSRGVQKQLLDFMVRREATAAAALQKQHHQAAASNAAAEVDTVQRDLAATGMGDADSYLDAAIAKEVVEAAATTSGCRLDSARAQVRRRRRELIVLIRDLKKAPRGKKAVALEQVRRATRIARGAASLLARRINEERSATVATRYWCSLAQAERLFGTTPKRGEKPAAITNGGSSIVPLEALSRDDQARLLSTTPPYFTVGVGIYSDGRWQRVVSRPVLKALNPNLRQQRALFVDTDMAEDMGIAFPEKEVIAMQNLSRRHLYCASQMEHPARIRPLRGLALNPTTGRRYSQPTHDILVTAALLRGYTSPYWLTEAQATRFYRVGLPRPEDFVWVSPRNAVVCRLDALPAALQRKLTVPPPSEEERGGATLILDAGSWEPVLHPRILDAMAQNAGRAYDSTLWVSLGELRRIDPQNIGARTPAGIFVRMTDEQKATTRDILDSVAAGAWLDLAQITRVKMYNAEATSNAMYVQPQDRNLALISGRCVNARLVSTLVMRAHERRFVSPVWLTPGDLLHLPPGIAIKPNEEPVMLAPRKQAADNLYNIDDFQDADEILRRNAVSADLQGRHCVLHAQWMPVLSQAKVRVLSQAKRQRPLWITHTEAILQGLRHKPDARPTKLEPPRAGRPAAYSRDALTPQEQAEIDAEADEAERVIGTGGRLLYNAEQTTDPVRVTALSFMNVVLVKK